MPIHIYWEDDDKTIIRSESAGSWTWEDYHKRLDEMVAMMKTVPHRVDMIQTSLPGAKSPGGSGLPHYQRALRLLPPNCGMLVFVTGSTFAKAIISIFINFSGGKMANKLTVAASLDDAHNIIAKQRMKAT